MTTFPRERPARMMRNGRDEDQQFDPNEWMYRRYLEDDFDGGYFRPVRFRFPPSLNRQRYSEPEDVIFSETGAFDEHGVLECNVAQLSLRLVDDREFEYSFLPVHRPEDNNYSHSEMWADCAQTGKRDAEPSQVAKKKFRTIASELFQIRIKSPK
jgi:hypothetical protein